MTGQFFSSLFSCAGLISGLQEQKSGVMDHETNSNHDHVA